MALTRCRRVAICLVLVSLGTASAQSPETASLEAQIRRLDRAEAEGLLGRDIAALEKLWAPDFTVNTPRNTVTRGRDQVVALVRNGSIDYSSFVREIEAIVLHEHAVVVMGSETVTPVNRAPLAGQTVRRRFTHVWMQRNGAWRLTARHANDVSPS